MIGELRLAGVTRRFGDQAALDGLDLTIRGGEFIALLGPSGCGKTTALNCLAGLLPLSGGEIHLDGDRIDGLAAGAARVRDGVPELRAVPAPVRAAQRRVRARDGRQAQAGAGREGRRGARPRRPAAARREVPGAALRRPAAARGDRPRGRDGAAADADGRAALQPRREAAPGDADRDPAAAPAARPDHGLRHPRPGGGAVARRPARPPARRRGRADRAARGALPAARQRLRGGLHGLPQPARDGGRRRAPPTATSASAPRA